MATAAGRCRRSSGGVGPLVLTLTLGIGGMGQALAQDEDEQEEAAPLLEPVEVTVPPQAERANSVTFLGQEDLQRQRYLILNDALFFGIPGLATSRQSNLGFFGPSGGFLIRGFGRQQVSVYVDGIPSQTTNHFHPISDQYTPDMIERVEVVRSPTGVTDGPNALGSLHIFTPAVPRQGVVGYADGTVGELDTRAVNGRVGHGWESGGFWIGGQRWRTDGVRDQGVDAKTINFKVAQDLGGAWGVKLRLADTEDLIEDRAPVAVDPGQGEFCFCSRAAVVTLDRTTMHSSSTFSLFGNSAEFITTRLDDGTRVNIETQQEDEYGVRLKHTWSELVAGNNLTIGFDATKFTLEEPELEVGEFWSPYVLTSQEFATLGDQTTVLTAGLRVTESNDFGSDVTPKIGVVQHIDPTTAVRLNIAKGFQIPRARQFGGGGDQLPNPDLDPAVLYSEEIGLNKTFTWRGRKGVFDIVAFLQQADEALRTEVISTSPLVTQVQNTGSFDHEGLETSVDYQLTRSLGLFVAATFLDLEATTDRAPAPEKTFDLRFDYRRGPLRFVWQTRDASDIVVRSPSGNIPLDDYTVSNAKLIYRVAPSWTLSANLENVTDEEFATFRPGFLHPGRTAFVGLRYER